MFISVGTLYKKLETKAKPKDFGTIEPASMIKANIKGHWQNEHKTVIDMWQ